MVQGGVCFLGNSSAGAL